MRTMETCTAFFSLGFVVRSLLHCMEGMMRTMATCIAFFSLGFVVRSLLHWTEVIMVPEVVGCYLQAGNCMEVEVLEG